MFPFRKTLGFRLLLISVILLAFPLLLDSFILAIRRYHDATRDAKNYLTELANFKEIPLKEIAPSSHNFLAIMEQFLQLESNYPNSPNEKINKQLGNLAALGDFHTILLVKTNPDHSLAIVGSNQKNIAEKDLSKFLHSMDLFSEENIHKDYVVRVAYDPITLQPFFIVTRPIYNKDTKQLVGFLIVTDTANLGKKLESLLAPDLKNYPVNFALLLPSSIVFSSSDPALEFHYFKPLTEESKKIFIHGEPFASDLLPEQPIKIEKQDGDFFEFHWQGKLQIGFIKELGEASYSLLTYASKEDIFTDPIHDFGDLYAVFILIICVGTLLTYCLVRRMAMPMSQLTRVMLKIREGQLEERYSFDRWGFEINQLGFTFNNMLDSLIEKKRRTEQERVFKEGYARELKLGQQVQRNLLPKEMPTLPGVEFASLYIPAIDVGGDYFDLFVDHQIEGDKLYLAVADASGKGVQACFYSLGVRSLLRTFAKHSDSLEKAMHSTNNIFCDDVGASGMFITVWMGEYDNRTKKLTYYSCGHNPPILRRKNGPVELLSVQDMAMGLLPSSDKKADTVALSEGDLLVLYTDGVTEAHNMKLELFGEDRLIAFAKQYGDLEAQAFLDKLIAEITLFVGKAPQHDDITLLVMRVVS